ncbi:Transposase family Tnp2 protein [Rhizoctonia solani]|uniref:Transposase family Tnp2 protein n=1 Tax=Rhizoctonia solani TaxID=456999 RepID=A0A8H8P6Z2_9AGAM|nr:Transposase family Tnp2 protein [Rhizoctonia solani]QRW24938.1 Transposase family Tnp2 protein [Rhizoctonia solani]
MNLSVSGATRPAPLPLGNNPLPSDAKEPHHDNSYIEDNDNAYPYPDDPDNPDNPDNAKGVLVEEPLIRVPPDDAKGPPKPPGNDGGAGMPLFDAHPTLRNIYLRTWAQYAFNHATQDSVQLILESHKLALMANAQYLPQLLVEEIQQMPLTLRSLERRLGMDHSELIRIYPVCPEPTCGRQYTMEQLYQLPNPQCTWNVGEQCLGILYTERLLANGTIKRSPSKSFPYIPLPAALGCLLSRPGMSKLCQHWRNNNNPNDEPTENPTRPQDPVEWFNNMPVNQQFSDISKGWGWRAHATGLTQQFINGNLTLNANGYQANKGDYTAGGSYTSNRVYIVINNLPYFKRNLFENTILAMVLPGPTEPKDYAFDQMMEPLIDNLISLSNGMSSIELPVHNAETGEIQDQCVYANLSVLVVDWIARIKCIGHVGATSKENHCPYCKLRACLLSTEQGYDHEVYDLCKPHKHLQHKHRWLCAEWCRAPL